LLVETSEALEALVTEARALAPKGETLRLALDCEADSYHCYREKLCLIQFCANERCAVIDPLKLTDLKPLRDLMAECDIWFHGSDYDLMLWKRTFNELPHFVFDTQIAAQLSGSTKFGLAALLEEHFGIVLEKEAQRADWGKRPLTDEMIEYAINDVWYLLPLADILLERLDALGRRDWFLQSCKANVDSAANRPGKDPDDAWRIRGWGKLRPRGWAYLKEIWKWRDVQAAKVDRPAFKVMANGKLLYLAERLQSGRDCELVGRFSEEQKLQFQEAIATAKACGDVDLPKRKRSIGRGRVSDFPERLDPFKAYRDERAEELELDPSLIASRSTMEELVVDPTRAEHLLMPWQREILAEALDRVEV